MAVYPVRVSRLLFAFRFCLCSRWQTPIYISSIRASIIRRTRFCSSDDSWAILYTIDDAQSQSLPKEVSRSLGVSFSAEARLRNVDNRGSFSPRSSTLRCLTLIPALAARASCESPCVIRCSRIVRPRDLTSTRRPSSDHNSITSIIGAVPFNGNASKNDCSRSWE